MHTPPRTLDLCTLADIDNYVLTEGKSPFVRQFLICKIIDGDKYKSDVARDYRTIPVRDRVPQKYRLPFDDPEFWSLADIPNAK